MNYTREFLLKTRYKLKMTAEQLSEQLNCSPRSVFRWEKGECVPDGNIILKIVKLCKEREIPMDDLFPFFCDISDIVKLIKTLYYIKNNKEEIYYEYN